MAGSSIVAIGTVDYAPDMAPWMAAELRRKWISDPFNMAMAHRPSWVAEPWPRLQKICGFMPGTLLNLLPPSNVNYWNTPLARITAKTIVEWAGKHTSNEIDCLWLVGRKVIEAFTWGMERRPKFGEWLTLPTVPPLKFDDVACSFIDALCLPHPSKISKEKFEKWISSAI